MEDVLDAKNGKVNIFFRNLQRQIYHFSIYHIDSIRMSPGKICYMEDFFFFNDLSFLSAALPYHQSPSLPSPGLQANSHCLPLAFAGHTPGYSVYFYSHLPELMPFLLLKFVAYHRCSISVFGMDKFKDK